MLITTLLVYAIMLACSANAQVTDVDVTAAQTLRPILVTLSEYANIPLALIRQYGILESSFGYHIHAGEDPNPVYKRARPFPETGLVSLFPFSPLGAPSTTYGIQRVEAWRLHWPWPPPNLKSIPDEERQTLWRWDVPKPLQQRWWTEAGGDGADRYWALCLYATNTPKDKGDPQLFYFDTLSGLRWQAILAMSQTLDNATAHEFTGEAETLLGVTADGSRVLALVTRPDKKASLLYVYNGSGKLLRTLRLAGYVAALQYGRVSWQLQRGPSGRTFLLRLRHRSDGAIDESLLVDSEGSFLARFVNDEGQPVHATLLSERHVVSRMQRQDGKWMHYIYELPIQK